MKHNNVIPNGHWKKKWQFRVRTWFNQPARKLRRRQGEPAMSCAGAKGWGRPDGRAAPIWGRNAAPRAPRTAVAPLMDVGRPHHRPRPSAARQEKAAKSFPRPAAGALRPVVHGQTVKYNAKLRLGRGFSLAELKVRGLTQAGERGRLRLKGAEQRTGGAQRAPCGVHLACAACSSEQAARQRQESLLCRQLA
jgi:large subunit ribosomal protein L13e